MKMHYALAIIEATKVRACSLSSFQLINEDFTCFSIAQEETQEYASEAKLRELVKRYSEFINFPIYLYESKEIDVPVDDEEESTPISSGDEIEDEGR